MNTSLSTVNVFTTKQYNAFKDQVGNREVTQTAVDTLQKKIEELNLLDYHPILVNSDMEVIDGQHRLAVAKRLKYPISYIKMPSSANANLECTQQINTTGKKWSMQDFLDSYCERGLHSYIRLREYTNKYPFISLANVLTIFSRGRFFSNKDFKEGRFSIEDISKAEVLAQRVEKFLKVDKKLIKNRQFIRALVLLDLTGITIDYDRLVELCRCNINEIKSLPRDLDEILVVLQKIYNFKLRNKVSFIQEVA